MLFLYFFVKFSRYESCVSPQIGSDVEQSLARHPHCRWHNVRQTTKVRPMLANFRNHHSLYITLFDKCLNFRSLSGFIAQDM